MPVSAEVKVLLFDVVFEARGLGRDRDWRDRADALASEG